MARTKKINIARRQAPQYWRVEITVEDPDLLFSLKHNMNYKKVFKASNANAAIRAAANYCTKYMNYYPGVSFSYSTKDVEPYFYINFASATSAEL